MRDRATCNALIILISSQVDEDMETCINLLSDTGPITIPVICRRKTVDLRIEPTVLDLGKIVVGESKKSSITVINDGCLPVAVKMESSVGAGLS